MDLKVGRSGFTGERTGRGSGEDLDNLIKRSLDQAEMVALIIHPPFVRKQLQIHLNINK